MVEEIDAAPLGMKCIGFQPSSKIFRIDCAREFCRGPGDQDIGTAGAQRHDLRVDGGIGDLVRGRLCGRFKSCAQHILQPADEVLAEIVVLIQHGEFRVRVLAQCVFGKHLRFDSCARGEAHGPGIGLVVAPLVAVHRQEQMRDLVRIDVFDDSRIGRGAEHVEQERDVVAFDQAPCLFDGFCRVEGVVIIDVFDLAAGDTALFIDHPEIGFLASRLHAQCRNRSAE